MESLKVATLCSLSPLEFWELTPYEFSLVINAYAKRREEEAEEKITLAYINAAWTIQFLGKNKPKLDKFIKKKPKKEMTDEEMLNHVKILNSMLGGEVNGS
ncbi:hypothetical protein [uncultured Clostridium sp.]|uniref:hypothetical protein n=1 Tax=uncultured Clostridium sp. TaxID=59620 RepID=UPI0025E4C393|nr:hypothetical protein [uncultured Clostridium sp.]